VLLDEPESRQLALEILPVETHRQRGARFERGVLSKVHDRQAATGGEALSQDLVAGRAVLDVVDGVADEDHVDRRERKHGAVGKREHRDDVLLSLGAGTRAGVLGCAAARV